MKKILGLMALVAICCLSFTSCSSYSPKAAEKMVDKYDDGDMKKADYETCIKWVEDYWADCEKGYEKAIADSKSEKKFEKALDKLDEELTDDKWEDIDDIIKMLNEASYDAEDDMGSANAKRWEKLRDKHNDKMEKLWEKAQKKFDK